MLSLAKHPEFQLGNVHTEFIPQHNDSLFLERSVVCESSKYYDMNVKCMFLLITGCDASSMCSFLSISQWLAELVL